MLIQSSALGNSFNALASLLVTYEIPILILASYRGYYKEKILAQVPLGKALPGMLESMKIPFVIIDRDLVNPDDVKEDIKLYSIPSTQIAQSLGNKIVANVVMLGALIAITGVVTIEDMIKSIKTTVPERVLEINLNAFEKGFEAGKQSMNSQ